MVVGMGAVERGDIPVVVAEREKSSSLWEAFVRERRVE